MRVVGLTPPRRLSVSLLVVALALVASASDAAASGNLVANGTFDTGVEGWVLDPGSPLNTLTFAANQDADSNPGSGAAEVRIGEGPFPPGGGYAETVAQCLPVVTGSQYQAQAQVRVPTTNQYANTEATLELFWYASPACAGSQLSNDNSATVGPNDQWQPLSVTATAPANARGVIVRLFLEGQDPAGPAQSYAFLDNVSLLGALPGDANCDKAVNAIDAALMLQHDAGLVGPLPCQDRADVNGDSHVNSLDAVLVLQFVAGLISTLPPP